MPAYVDFDPAQPDQSVDAGVAFGGDLLNNLAALRDATISGLFKGYTYSQSGGTAERPTDVRFTKGAHIVRHTITWTDTGGGAYQATTVAIDRSLDTGGTWDAIQTIVLTYDGSGNLTATTVGGGWLAKIMQLWGKVTKAVADLATHIAGTGTGVHGLATMSTQAAGAVAITGGTINGTTLGATTPADADTTRVREAFHDYGAIANGGTVTLELDKYAAFAFTPDATTTSTITIALSGAPAAGKYQGWRAYIINGRRSVDGKITYPASTHWNGGSATRPLDTALELSGRNGFAFDTCDGSIFDWQSLGKRG